MTAAEIAAYTADDMMTIAAARALAPGTVCFVGIGLPSTAANLARRLHAPDCVLVYESGCIGAKPTRLPLSIGDGVLADRADAVIGVPEIFAYWLQAGRIDVGFLGAAQIDRFGNVARFRTDMDGHRVRVSDRRAICPRPWPFAPARAALRYSLWPALAYWVWR